MKINDTPCSPQMSRPQRHANTMLVRVGCVLEYEVAQPVVVLLQLAPREYPGQTILQQSFVADNDRPLVNLLDQHGNALVKTMLRPGINTFRHDAIVAVPELAALSPAPQAGPSSLESLPWDVLRYTMPSRYCEADKLTGFAFERFGHIPPGSGRVQAICDWTHQNIEYRYGCGSAFISAFDVLERGYGVCRDFAHVMIALCRALDIPARYVAGHIPYLGEVIGDIGVDFHAFCEVHVDGAWHLYDPRHGQLRAGPARVAQGLDAADTAIATIYGHARLVTFQVWAYQVDSASRMADPVAIVRGSDGTAQVVDANA